jgi:hypothetical protein
MGCMLGDFAEIFELDFSGLTEGMLLTFFVGITLLGPLS